MSKHHIVTDAGGVPLASTLTTGNTHDVTEMEGAVDAIQSVTG